MGTSGNTAANATAESLTVGGHKVYSLYTKASQAYWRDGSKSGMPLGSEPQGIYIVTSGKHFSSGCCYDYGNGETSRTYVAGPSMDAVYFGTCTIWAHRERQRVRGSWPTWKTAWLPRAGPARTTAS